MTKVKMYCIWRFDATVTRTVTKFQTKSASLLFLRLSVEDMVDVPSFRRQSSRQAHSHRLYSGDSGVILT